ncbi:MAG: nucleotidyltransferase family protein [Candidatus Omnitrophota bacterium]|nr:nucleotidyltransferase family protein [Candidatus Omnitrophota bacterium]
MIKAIILAGGRGLRLRSILKDVPKPMAPIAGKPFLEYLILQLVKWNVKDIVLSVGYKKEVIKAYFGGGRRWNVKIIYSEEDNPLGTGGALKKSVKLIENKEFLVMNGDSFLDLDFNQIIDFHKKKKALASVGLACVNDISRFGKVEINSRNEVVRFIEKGSGGKGTINGGVYVFDREIINYISPGKVSLEKEVLPRLIKWGLYGIVTQGFFIDIGIPRDFLNLSEEPGKLLNAII